MGVGLLDTKLQDTRTQPNTRVQSYKESPKSSLSTAVCVPQEERKRLTLLFGGANLAV